MTRAAWRRALAAHAAARRNQRSRTRPPAITGIRKEAPMSEPSTEATEPAGDVEPDILTADDDAADADAE